ncbi:elongation factor-like GTPase 1 [Trichonephila clavata]|uniref:Elongation factor-like GTPase 1 n=1 Tax=Trichonephila clavata TaxID=2740835 RepID=A0A8X6LQF7_TRICU|nr:elongation factor-like GTPase 1 [Trichonephila clavata]
MEKNEIDANRNGCILIKTSNKLSSIKIRAKPLPPEITKLLEENTSLLKILDQVYHSRNNGESDDILTHDTIIALDKLKKSLDKHFIEAGNEWKDVVDQIWSFGPRRCGPNILLNRIPNYKRPSIWTTTSIHLNFDSPHMNYDSTFISGFQLATLCGPLCDEPMMGVCFIVEDWSFDKDPLTVVVDDSDISVKTELNDTTTTSKEMKNVSKQSDTSSVESSELSSSNSTPFGPFTGKLCHLLRRLVKRRFKPNHRG